VLPPASPLATILTTTTRRARRVSIRTAGSGSGDERSLVDRCAARDLRVHAAHGDAEHDARFAGGHAGTKGDGRATVAAPGHEDSVVPRRPRSRAAFRG